MSQIQPLPYWQVNVPEQFWQAKCPGFLCNISSKLRDSLMTADAEYERISWTKAQSFIGLALSKLTC